MAFAGILRWALALVLLASTTSCIKTDFFGKNTYLLNNQIIRGNRSIPDAEMQPLFRQRQNRKVLGSYPYAYVYVIAKKANYDSTAIANRIVKLADDYDNRIAKIINQPSKSRRKDSISIGRLEARKEKKLKKLERLLKEGNYFMRVVGEKPEQFDSSLAKETVEQIKRYYYQNGFFQAWVRYRTDTIAQRINTIYYVDEGRRHYIRSVKFKAEDPAIQTIIAPLAASSAIQAGKPFSLNDQEAARETVTQTLRKNGYVGFPRNFVFIENDTAHSSKDSTLGMDVTLFVSNPSQGRHLPYKVKEILFDVEEYEGWFDHNDTADVNRIRFVSPYKGQSWNILASRILLRPGAFYDQISAQKSQATLTALDLFQFVNLAVDTVASSDSSRKFGYLTMHYRARKLPRYQISAEGGGQVSVGALGPYANASFKTRNIFNTFSSLEFGGRYSNDGMLSPYLPNDQIYRATEVNLSSTISIPRLLLPNQIPGIRNVANPSTRLTLNYINTRRPEYDRQLVRANMAYNISLSRSQLVEISPISVQLAFTERLNPLFSEVLGNLSRTLQQSFANALVTSFNSNYIFSNSKVANATAGTNRTIYLRLGAEVGGLTGALISRQISTNPDSVGRLKIFRFYRINLDFRRVEPLGRSTQLAFRINAGMGRAIGVSNTLPWEKFFFAGGGYSVRAWAPRRLGPGSYNAGSVQAQNLFERPGNILIESSVELRQRALSKFTELAVFVDAGNVWTSIKNPEQVGADFELNRFYQEFAVGTGFGIRGTFPFIIVRFDFGMKVFDPAEPLGRRFVLPRTQRLVFNFGLGYPF